MVSVPIATPPLWLPAPIQSAVICGQGSFPYQLVGDNRSATVAQSNAEYPIRSCGSNPGTLIGHFDGQASSCF